MTIRECLLEQLEDELHLTNWHLNDYFWVFYQTFYKDLCIRDAQRKYSYHANKLVKEGIVEKARKNPLGPGALFEFGTRTQTTWEPKRKR